MRYGKQNLWKVILSSPITPVILFIVLAFLAKATLSIYSKARVSQNRLVEAQAELGKLQARQADLAHKVDYLSTDQGVEAEMRTKYRAVKEGESVAVIVDNTAAAAAIQASSTPQIGWWGRLLGFFGL